METSEFRNRNEEEFVQWIKDNSSYFDSIMKEVKKIYTSKEYVYKRSAELELILDEPAEILLRIYRGEFMPEIWPKIKAQM